MKYLKEGGGFERKSKEKKNPEPMGTRFFELFSLEKTLKDFHGRERVMNHRKKKSNSSQA